MVKTLVKQLNFFLIILLVVACDEYHSNIIKVDVINELQDCEEHNLDYTIIRVYDSLNVNLKNTVILPELFNELNNTENNDLFFPSKTLERKVITISGKYSKPAKKNSEGLYSCLGEHKFKVLEVNDVEIVTDEMDFSINN